jgi:hypothetical protein
MGAPVQESDDGKPSKSEPPKNASAKDTPKDVGAPPSSRATEAPAPPWKRKPRHDAFEGDVAVVELRSRLALRPEQIQEPLSLRPERIQEPVVSSSTAPTFSGVLRLMSGVAMAATMVGVAGYLWGFNLSTEMPELTPGSDRANVLPAASTPVASRAASNRDFDPPAAQTTIGLAPIGTHGGANPVTSSDAAQRPALLPMPRQTVSPIAPRAPMAAEDAPLITAKMKIGVELMTYGEVAAARVMFQRAAEAGEAAGAFALAETYDPLVLGGLRLREGVIPDLALARTWYERARDLGSLEARDRISRLALLPR